MLIVSQNKDRFTINNLFYCCEALIFTHPLVYEFLCGPKHMGTPVIQVASRMEFEDDLRPGVLSDNPSVRTSSLVTPVL